MFSFIFYSKIFKLFIYIDMFKSNLVSISSLFLHIKSKKFLFGYFPKREFNIYLDF